MNARNYRLKCRNCETPFSGLRPTDKYCSSTCRYAWQHKVRTEAQKARKQSYQKKWGQDNWLKRRAYMLNYTYGISLDQYDEMLQRQNYRCAICERHETEFAKKLAVDHDHKTQEIFGLLCQDCNHVLVGKHRDPSLFHKAAEYLKQGTGWFAPVRPKKKRRRKSAR